MGHLPPAALTNLHQLETAIWQVLAGQPITLVAARTHLAAHQLADAAERYQAAGHATLARDTEHSGWLQINIQFTTPRLAENIMAEHVSPILEDAERHYLVTNWWFIRKTPWWRLRWRPTPQTPPEPANDRLHSVLDTLQAAGHIVGHRPGIYEPEIVTFGGPTAVEIAHDLFHADSRNLLAHAHSTAATQTRPTIDAPELSILLCSALLRAAGQDLYEQGDIWARVSNHRPAHDATQRRTTLGPLRRLLTADPRAANLPANSPLSGHQPWIEAFHRAGTSLAETARRGTLQRGIRAILAHHVIFHWNRLGMPYAKQSVLAASARDVILTHE